MCGYREREEVVREFLKPVVDTGLGATYVCSAISALEDVHERGSVMLELMDLAEQCCCTVVRLTLATLGLSKTLDDSSWPGRISPPKRLH